MLVLLFRFITAKSMGSSGLEPPTSRLSGARSNQLSYEPLVSTFPIGNAAYAVGFFFPMHKMESGSHLLSRAVPRQVSSAVYVLTVVFGMGTGVSHRRIATRNLLLRPFRSFKTKQLNLPFVSIERR